MTSQPQMGQTAQMGLDLNINWEDILKSASGELTAQALQSQEVQDLIKASGGDIAVKTAGDKLTEYKATMSNMMNKLGEYKFWLLGGLAALAIYYFSSRRVVVSANPKRRAKKRKSSKRK